MHALSQKKRNLDVGYVMTNTQQTANHKGRSTYKNTPKRCTHGMQQIEDTNFRHDTTKPRTVSAASHLHFLSHSAPARNANKSVSVINHFSLH